MKQIILFDMNTFSQACLDTELIDLTGIDLGLKTYLPNN